MIDHILNMLAPHYCYGCGITGTLLCHNCKENIISEPYTNCVLCNKLCNPNRGTCHQCQNIFSRAWVVSERKAELKSLIDAYKFSRVRSAYRPLVELLNDSLPVLPPTVVVCTIPTISSHIRRRGYDHTELIAKLFANKRGLVYERVLSRVTNAAQRGADRKTRLTQMQNAFILQSQIDPDTIYLVIDDVVTTGSTLKAASAVLRDAGVKEVWAAAIARQPLDS